MRLGRDLIGAALIGALAGCGSPYSPTPTRRAQDASIPAPPTTAAPDTPLEASALPLPEGAGALGPSAASRAMAAYYAQIESELLGRGLLRSDIAPKDAPFTARQLAENFLRVATYDEYRSTNGALVAGERVSKLRRWAGPVRVGVEFGASVPESARARDRAEVSAFAGRLGRVTGHSVRMGGPANFTVLIVNEDERRAIGPRLSALVPGISRGVIEATQSLPASSYCVVYTFSQGTSPDYTRAVAIIRAEHPAKLRRACLHEELAQGMGLANDSPRARPSIFNDDEEFALLTRHDEYLLKMLYDPRLSAGMSEAEARPIAQTIAAELLGGDS